MTHFKRCFALIATAAIFLATTAHAQVQERTVKFATQNPKGHPIVSGMEKFAEIVTAKSGGKIKIMLFPGGVLAAMRRTFRRCRVARSTWSR
jgi:TRAP-type C4-dicarboxylate transport system substrate-binding protein